MKRANLVRLKLLILLGGIFLVLPWQTGLADNLHYDAGVTSDYVWRGLTQTRGKPAVQAGVEMVTAGNWYFGGWISNTQHEAYDYGSAEIDLYVGKTGQSDSFGYDLGFINYQYPAYSGSDFTEMYFALMTDMFMFKYSDSTDVGIYMEVNITYEVSKQRESKVILHFGNYDRRGRAKDYFDMSVTYYIKKLSLSLSKASVDSEQDKDLKAYVRWNESF